MELGRRGSLTRRGGHVDGWTTQDGSSLYIRCVTSACFTYTLFTCLTFLHTCPKPQPVTVLIEGEVRSLIVSLVTKEPTTDVSSPCNWQFPLTRAETATMTHTVGCHSRTLLQTHTLPLSIKHVPVADSALSLVLKLVKHNPCRPVGCSPTAGKHKLGKFTH